MEREVIFRGKRLDNGQWVEGFLIVGVLGSFILRPDYAFPNEEMNKDVVEVIPETVGQFTGLLDKAGERIFEGDILRGTFGSVVEAGLHNFRHCLLARDAESMTRWHHSDFEEGWLKENDSDGNWTGKLELKKIGNKFDSPELIKPTGAQQ